MHLRRPFDQRTRDRRQVGPQDRLGGVEALLVLAGGDQDRRARLLRVVEHAHGVAQAGRDVQIDHGELARGLRIAVRHRHDRRLLQAEQVAQLVLGRECVHQRQFGSAGIAEHDLDAFLLEQVEEGALSGHHGQTVLPSIRDRRRTVASCATAGKRQRASPASSGRRDRKPVRLLRKAVECCHRPSGGDMRRPPMLPAAPLIALLLVAGVTSAAGQGESLAGRSVQMIIGFGPGGGYDLWGRTVGRHIGRHLPGRPTVIPQNMPGAGSYAAASYIFNVAPKDGTVLGIIARDAALGPLSGAAGARFDPPRLSWIGTPVKETNVCIAFHTAHVKTVQDLYDKQLILGDTGPGTGTRSYPKALNELLGMKFKLVGGFPSSADVFLAMERGEVDGICESLDSVKIRRPNWIPDKMISILFQGGAEPNPELKGVPLVRDLARSDGERQAIDFLYAGQGIGRPFVAPPDLPAERLKALRQAFDATMQDADFIAEAKNSKLELAPEDGEHLAALIMKIYATPK